MLTEQFDGKAKERRGQFNMIVDRLAKAKNNKPAEKDCKEMSSLADRKSGPANYGAAAATPECQYQLGKLLLESPKPDRVQAVAWLELADAHGSAEAHELAVIEAPKLLPEQSFAVERLRVALEHKR